MNCIELKALAKKKKIKGYYKMNKEELSFRLGIWSPIERQVGGGKKCEHGKIMRFCKPCGGSAICSHGIRKYVCIYPVKDHNFVNTLNKNINVENVERNERMDKFITNNSL